MKVAIILVSLCLPAVADLAAGLQALKNGDYATALRELLPLAKQGDAVAQFNLGSMYDEGQGVRQDYTEAIRWYREAAEQGNVSAQFNLALAYESGHGVPQDYVEAVRWYRKAAEQGEARAQNNLGLIYAHDAFLDDLDQREVVPDPEGRVPKDYAEAIRWFRQAAEQGNAKAQFSLAFRYEQGQEVPRNYAEAIRWYRKAAEQGEPHAQFNLGVMYAKGQGVPQDYVQGYLWIDLGTSRSSGEAQRKFAADRDRLGKAMTAQQIREAQRLAREWKPKAGTPH
ncbi:MAG: tetratricopeptide repeat protein [Bryobacteraceae bacterium]